MSTSNTISGWTSSIQLPLLTSKRNKSDPINDKAGLSNLQLQNPSASNKHTPRPTPSKTAFNYLLNPSGYFDLSLSFESILPNLPVLPPVPGQHSHRSKVAQLWLLSRILPDTLDKDISPKADGTTKSAPSNKITYRDGGLDRPITLLNIRIALTLAWSIWQDVLNLFFSEEKLHMGLYFMSKIVKGVTPAAQIWVTSCLLDLVQQAISGTTLPPTKVLSTAGWVLFLSISLHAFNHFSRLNDTFVRSHLTHLFQHRYLKAKMSLSLTALGTPYTDAMLDDAGVMCGLQYREVLDGYLTYTDPYKTLDCGLLQLPQHISEIFSHIALLLLAVQWRHTICSWSGSFLIVLALAPALLKVLGQWARSRRAKIDPKASQAMTEVRGKLEDVSGLGQAPGYAQEIVLYGLADWILGKWEYLRSIIDKDNRKKISETGNLNFGLNVLEETANVTFYVLLALKTLPTNLSIGAIRQCQASAQALGDAAQTIGETVSEVFQTIFYLAAFLEATNSTSSPKYLSTLASKDDNALVGYESLRQLDQGMTIEAKNMDFTYPGSNKPILTNINLSIQPGTTLAIVGYNGGGKTTLVKALMGLYEHTGTLLINGIPSEEIDPKTLHKRTACLFQDFATFSLSFRENVGLGNVALMTNDEAIQKAIKNGNAEAISEKVGLDGILGTTGSPKKEEEEDKNPSLEPEVKAKASESDEDEKVGAQVVQVERAMEQDNQATETPLKFESTNDPSASVPPPSTCLTMLAAPSKLSPAQAQLEHDTEDMREDKAKEKGTSLSGGQWQRVALSRAFLRANEADLVVFDEPSSALDPQAEAELFQHIHALSHQGGRKTTTIYISHRFATVKKADQIAFVDNGTITELGTHTELMALNGQYRKLYNLQKDGFNDDPSVSC